MRPGEATWCMCQLQIADGLVGNKFCLSQDIGSGELRLGLRQGEGIWSIAAAKAYGGILLTRGWMLLREPTVFD